MSQIEGEFLTAALEIGLAQAVLDAITATQQAIIDFPPGPETRYLQRLYEQRAALREPNLRTSAALVVSICARNPELASRIRAPFANLVERHPDLSWFYAQMPATLDVRPRAS